MYHYPCVIVQKRLLALHLVGSTNLPYGQIALIVGIHRDTVTDYIRSYNEGGLDLIYKVGYGTNTSELEKHTDSLLSHFEQHPARSINEAIEAIKNLTGIQRSPSAVKSWMKRHGLRYRKTGQIPAKADADKQKLFIEKDLIPLIDKAKKEQIHLLFLDAAHFVMGVFLCCLWSIKRIFVKSSSGRKRYNVLGAVDAITHQIHTFTNTSYINAECICDFLEQLYYFYSDGKPIYIVMDNARYQKCQLVKYIAWQFNIQLVYLPAYSPNLNIIERLWKWTKKKALYAKFYDDFRAFKKAIDETVQNANTQDKYEIQSLLSLKFQTF
jgi:transposase